MRCFCGGGGGGVSRESLLHTGTGELVALDGFGHCLCRSERGFAILRRDGKPDRFTFDVFAISYHRANVDGEEYFFRYHRASGESTASEDFARTATRSYAFVSTFLFRRFVCELFISSTPMGAGCVRWGMAKILDATIGPDRTSKWMGRHSLQLQALISEFGIDHELHFFSSTRAIVMKASLAT